MMFSQPTLDDPVQRVAKIMFLPDAWLHCENLELYKTNNLNVCLRLVPRWWIIVC